MVKTSLKNNSQRLWLRERKRKAITYKPGSGGRVISRLCKCFQDSETQHMLKINRKEREEWLHLKDEWKNICKYCEKHHEIIHHNEKENVLDVLNVLLCLGLTVLVLFFVWFSLYCNTLHCSCSFFLICFLVKRVWSHPFRWHQTDVNVMTS